MLKNDEEAFVRLGRRVAASLDGRSEERQEQDELLVRTVRANVVAGICEPSSAKARARTWQLVAMGAAAATVFALALLLVPRLVASPVTPAASGSQAVLETGPGQARPLTFADGTNVELRERSRLVVADYHGSTGRAVLQVGTVDVHVEHHADTNWLFEAGPYRVRVVGTRFKVGWDPTAARFDLEVSEGSVRVSGPQSSGEVAVSAGQTLRLSGAAVTTDVGSGDGSPAVVSPASDAGIDRDPRPTSDAALGAPAAASVASPTRPAVRASAGWQEAADRGDFTVAVARARAEGIDRLCQKLPVDELAQLADVARLGGDPASARVAYGSLRTRFPGSSAAGTATFGLARIDVDARNPRAALSGFERYLSENPSGALRREALGRVVELADGLGDAERARGAATDYLALYPGGPHAAVARGVLSR